MRRDDELNAPRHGVAEPLADGLRRVLAPNPSPMTLHGTNSYILGTRGIAVIDPGPDDPEHLEALLAALEPGQRITHILVTHAHLDHSPGARTLSARTGAPVLAFGDAYAGRSAAMTRLAAAGGVLGGGEGVDTAFVPDVCLDDGAAITGDGWRLTAFHLPGHFGNHMGFSWGETLFTGDLVMGWASSLVSPPDGDVTDFMASLGRLSRARWHVFHPGHGAPVADPATRLAGLLAHRRAREAAILAALAKGPADAATLTHAIYTDTAPVLLPAAERNVLAHLIDLLGKGAVETTEPLTPTATFTRL